MSKTIATLAGREKLAKARAGVAPLPRCAFIALGSGGADSGGTLKEPTDTATGLFSEVVRREITQPPTFPIPTTATYAVTLLVGEYADVVFNEIGLIDADGTLIAAKTFNPKQKDEDMEMGFEIEDVF